MISKRHVAWLLAVALVLGGGAVAWSQDEGPPADRPARREALARCRAEAGVAEGQKPTAEQRRAAAECLRAAGFHQRRHHHHGEPAGVLGRAIHGDLIVRTEEGGFETVAYDRGEQKSRSGTRLTIVRPDGVEVTVELTGDTRYKGVDGADQLQDGRPTVVVSKDGKARLVGQGHREQGPPQR
jgi:hypothetical protein